MKHRPNVREIVERCHGRGFIESSDLLTLIEAADCQDAPISGVLSRQGRLKALGTIMRGLGHSAVRSTGGKRGYRL